MASYPASKPGSQRHTLSVLVENRPGVLARISGLFEHYGIIELVRSGAVAMTRGPRALSEKVVGSEITGR